MNSTPPLNNAAPVAPQEPESSVRQLQSQFRSLQAQLMAVFVTMVIMNLSVNLFFWKQMSVINKQAHDLQQVVTNYTNNDARRMNDFLNQLRDVARTNAEFALILTKYKIEVSKAPNIPMPAESGEPRR